MLYIPRIGVVLVIQIKFDVSPIGIVLDIVSDSNRGWLRNHITNYFPLQNYKSINATNSFSNNHVLTQYRQFVFIIFS